MDGAINFTIGLSEGIAWPWPIAVYLFLAGISGGAVAVALMLNFFRHKTETRPSSNLQALSVWQPSCSVCSA